MSKWLIRIVLTVCFFLFLIFHQSQWNNTNTIMKSKVVTAMLAWFLGMFGAHYFYLGKTKAGLFTLLLCWLTCGIGYVILSWVFFIQGIFLLINDEEYFQKKWIDPEYDTFGGLFAQIKGSFSKN